MNWQSLPIKLGLLLKKIWTVGLGFAPVFYVVIIKTGDQFLCGDVTLTASKEGTSQNDSAKLLNTL